MYIILQALASSATAGPLTRYPSNVMLTRRLVVLTVAGLLGLVASAPAQQGATFSTRLAAIAAGDNTAARRQAITADLGSSGVAFRLEEFAAPAGAPPAPAGTNILASVPARNPANAKVLLLSAHYDRVPAGRGVVDNGASCAVLLGLMARFKSAPLERYSVAAAFFDLEEIGLVGSRAYVDAVKAIRLPDAAINLDVFAYGDTLYGAASLPQGPLASAIAGAARETSLPLRMTDASRNEYPPSDHRPLIAAGVETVALSLMDGPEIDGLITLLKAGPGAAPPPGMPRVLTLIHTPTDTLDQARAADVEKAVPVLERAIRLLDAGR
jgi:aminopeptidase S